MHYYMLTFEETITKRGCKRPSRKREERPMLQSQGFLDSWIMMSDYLTLLHYTYTTHICIFIYV